MKSINISLPDTMRAYVEQLQTMLLEGLNSGEATQMTAQDWEDIRQAVRNKINKRQSQTF